MKCTPSRSRGWTLVPESVPGCRLQVGAPDPCTEQLAPITIPSNCPEQTQLAACTSHRAELGGGGRTPQGLSGKGGKAGPFGGPCKSAHLASIPPE